MRRNHHCVLMLLVFATCGVCTAEKAKPRYFTVTPTVLKDVKERFAAGDPSVKPAMKALLKDADKALETRPPSVTEKPRPAVSGDKHDYMTAAPYYWPSPGKPDGLPYIRKDGRVNPAVRTSDYDHGRVGVMAKTVETLALAYYLALMLDHRDLARKTAESAKRNRIAAQIEPDGRQPRELTRSTSFGYSRFNLTAFFSLATLAGHAGVDLWHYRTDDGRSIRKALDFLIPYITKPEMKWPYPQIKDIKPGDLAPLLMQAASIYQDRKYTMALASLEANPQDRMHLLVSRDSPPIDVPALDRDRILKAAEAALSRKNITITQFPAKLSEGGPNDFYSNGDYWWPDPTKPDGLPYIRRDGETNPGNSNQHRMAIRDLRDAVAALAAAWQITREERYATRAAEMLDRFFLNSATRMNPHLRYAQAIPGVSPGRGIGIIDTLHLIELPMAIQAMKVSSAFPEKTLAGLEKWFVEYLDWMLTSKNGKEEAATKNNHAVAFWLQAAVFASFTGNETCLAECRRRFKEVFVPEQMAADGSFPAELARTKPYAYSIFQLDNMATLCQVLSTPDDNLWHFELPDGRGIKKAVAYLFPYLADKSKWPLKPDVASWGGWPARQPSLVFAGFALGKPDYLALWRKLPPDPSDPEVQRNIAITQPLLWLQAR